MTLLLLRFWILSRITNSYSPRLPTQTQKSTKIQKVWRSQYIVIRTFSPHPLSFPFPFVPSEIFGFFFISFNQYIQIYLIVPIFNNVHDIFLYGCIFIIFFYILSISLWFMYWMSHDFCQYGIGVTLSIYLSFNIYPSFCHPSCMLYPLSSFCIVLK